ncbi:MAG: ribosome maturation factor RimP [Lachnospiraceae bacterium]|nr:ribosome maturation factor RimP [Lachnospiraceae bacterium]
MSRKDDYEAKAEKLVAPLLEQNGFSLYDVEYVKEAGTYYLRIYIDKPGGITIDDCEIVSRAYSDLLDENDFISDAYIMEVSSPGLGRQLKKDRHFENSMGEEVELKLYKPVDGSKEYTGILTSFSKDTITIEVAENEFREFNRSDISIIRLTIDF